MTGLSHRAGRWIREPDQLLAEFAGRGLPEPDDPVHGPGYLDTQAGKTLDVFPRMQNHLVHFIAGAFGAKSLHSYLTFCHLSPVLR